MSKITVTSNAAVNVVTQPDSLAKIAAPELVKKADRIDALYHRIKAGCGIAAEVLEECGKKFAIGCAVGFVDFFVTTIFSSVVLDQLPLPSTSVSLEKPAYNDEIVDNPLNTCLLAPILEELFYRVGLQGTLLEATPWVVTKWISPGKENWVDSEKAKICRIGLTSLFFGAAHLQNNHAYGWHQAILSAWGGVVYGVLKENRPGIIGAIGAHIVYNSMMLSCM